MQKIINDGEVEKTIAQKWCRRQWVLLRNVEENKYGLIDMFEKRYQRMRERVSEWAGVMDMLSKEIPGSRLIMITLTIAKVKDYSPGMIREYLKSLKYRLGKDLWGFAWIAEMQKRGAVHYHLLIMVPKYKRVPMPDKSGMWKWGMSRVEKAKTAYYLCVYIGKERQKELSRYPKSCRTYAVSYRLPEGTTKAYLNSLREVQKHEKIMGVIKNQKIKEWEYVGSTVNKDYAEKVLTPFENQGSGS